MALDTIDKVAHQLLLHCPLAGKPLATLWASNSWLKLAETYDRWSWRIKFGQFNVPAAYDTGLITITSADPTLITGSGGAVFTQSMVGRQFRLGYSFGYDIIEFLDSQHVRIGLPWGDIDQVAVPYQIVQQYVTVPEDFASFISVLDVTRNFRLRTGVERREIDQRDPRRTASGIAYALADAGYAPSFAGSVDATPFQVRGSGPAPSFGGAFNGPTDTVYVVEITVGGVTGTAQFKWRRGTGAYVTGVLTDGGGVGLSGNIVVNWDPTSTLVYALGDIFVIRARAQQSFGLPRFEMWPVQLSQVVYPYYYYTTPPDLTVPGTSLPRTIRGAVVLKGAMAEARAWAGRGLEKNPLYDLKGSVKDAAEFESDSNLLVLRDDEMYPKDVTYFSELPFAGPPWDAMWEMRHA